jgi:HSP20 family molecular chaperone IbpA
MRFDDTFQHLQPSRIEQSDNAVDFELSVPGFRDDEVQVTVDGNLLKIKGDRSSRDHKAEMDEQGRVISSWKSNSYSSLSESFRLPYGLNTSGMTKNIENGVLKVHIPKLAIADRPAQQQQGTQQQPQQQQQLQQQPQSMQQGASSKQSSNQAQRGTQQHVMMMWPPRVTTERMKDGNTLQYTVHLPNVRKEDIRLNVEDNKLYLTIAEHFNDHMPESCTDCGTYRQHGKEASRRTTRGSRHAKAMTSSAQRSGTVRRSRNTRTASARGSRSAAASSISRSALVLTASMRNSKRTGLFSPLTDIRRAARFASSKVALSA